MVSLEAGHRGRSRRFVFAEPSRASEPLRTLKRDAGPRRPAVAGLIVILPLLLAGCYAPRQYSWYKPGVEESEAQKDLADCEHQARVSVRQSRIPGETAAGADYDILVQRSQVIESCMKGRGYRGQ